MDMRNKWNKEEISFTGIGYDKKSKKVVKGPNYGFVTLPKALIGKFVRVIIIDDEQTTESEQKSESREEVLSQEN